MSVENRPAWVIEHFKNPGPDWTPLVVRSALAMKVLAVAQTRVEGAWSAYIDAVPGMDHEAEQEAVLRHGEKLPEAVARLLFPSMEAIPYAR